MSRPYRGTSRDKDFGKTGDDAVQLPFEVQQDSNAAAD
jgi:hypothetical protein